MPKVLLQSPPGSFSQDKSLQSSLSWLRSCFSVFRQDLKLFLNIVTLAAGNRTLKCRKRFISALLHMQALSETLRHPNLKATEFPLVYLLPNFQRRQSVWGDVRVSYALMRGCGSWTAGQWRWNHVRLDWFLSHDRNCSLLLVGTGEISIIMLLSVKSNTLNQNVWPQQVGAPRYPVNPN